MAKEGSIAERLKAVKAEIDEEARRYQANGIPGPKQIYRMGDSEFMHHIHVNALTKILKDKLDISEEEVELYLSQAFLEEMKIIFKFARQKQLEELQKRLQVNPNDLPPGFGKI